MWRPILDPAASSRAWAAIETIERSLATRPALAASGTRRGPDLSLASGEAGVALFLAYLDVARDGEEAGDLAFDSISRCVSGLGGARLSPMLATGFTGIGWALEHLAGSYFEADDDLSESIDEALHTLLAEPTETPPFELLGGVVGLGTYLLERPLRPVVADTLERVVTVLESSAEEVVGRRGVAHVPRMAHPGAAPADARRLLRPGGGPRHPGRHRLPGRGVAPRARRPEESGACSKAPSDGSWPTGCRPRRCGLRRRPSSRPGCRPGLDAGPHGLVLRQPGDRGRPAGGGAEPGNPDWEDEALRLARLAARRPPAATRATDPGLCHGIAGLAHLFNRLFQATGDPELETATRAWYAGSSSPGARAGTSPRSCAGRRACREDIPGGRSPACWSGSPARGWRSWRRWPRPSPAGTG